MSVRTKLILNLISAFLVFAMIGLGVTSVLSEKKYVWNSNVSIISDISDLNLEIYGLINSAQVFETEAENGEIDNSHWEIASSATKFTKEERTITISLRFVNRSAQSLRISVQGILIDPLQRYTTEAKDLNGVGITITQDTETSLGSLETVLPGGNDEVKMISLVYVLEKTNIAIENETQNLTVSISLNEEV